MLTEKQDRVFKFLKNYRLKFGHAPTQEEIKRHFGFSAISTVHDYLKALEKKGVIARQAGKWSGIELTDRHVPLLGKVAAGRPLEWQQDGEKLEVPQRMLRGGGEYFALQVVGDSMIDEGILEDDFVIIRRQATATNGEIVVARIENEATIKRFYKKRSQIELHSANPKYAPLVVTAKERFAIEGVFCGLMRF